VAREIARLYATVATHIKTTVTAYPRAQVSKQISCSKIPDNHEIDGENRRYMSY